MNPHEIGSKQKLWGLFCILPYIYNSNNLIITLLFITYTKMQKSPHSFQSIILRGLEKAFFLKNKITKCLLIQKTRYTSTSSAKKSTVYLRPLFLSPYGAFFYSNSGVSHA